MGTAHIRNFATEHWIGVFRLTGRNMIIHRLYRSIAGWMCKEHGDCTQLRSHWNEFCAETHLSSGSVHACVTCAKDPYNNLCNLGYRFINLPIVASMTLAVASPQQATLSCRETSTGQMTSVQCWISEHQISRGQRPGNVSWQRLMSQVRPLDAPAIHGFDPQQWLHPMFDQIQPKATPASLFILSYECWDADQAHSVAVFKLATMEMLFKLPGMVATASSGGSGGSAAHRISAWHLILSHGNGLSSASSWPNEICNFRTASNVTLKHVIGCSSTRRFYTTNCSNMGVYAIGLQEFT